MDVRYERADGRWRRIELGCTRREVNEREATSCNWSKWKDKKMKAFNMRSNRAKISLGSKKPTNGYMVRGIAGMYLSGYDARVHVTNFLI